jgi:hypothetical protein
MTRPYLHVGRVALSSKRLKNHWQYLCRSFSTNETQMSRFTFSRVFRLLMGRGHCCVEYLNTNGHNKSLLELTHLVGSEHGSVLSEYEHEDEHYV